MEICAARRVLWWQLHVYGSNDWANQLGLLTCNANGGHMLRALEHMRQETLRVEPDAANTVYEVNSIDVHGTPGYQRLCYDC